MRIIAGKHRGRVLAEFGGKAIRPTSDRVKESLFSILSARIPSARVLDLFCGTGALGLECISRGAAEVVFNDLSRDSLAVLRKNLALLRETAAISQSDFRTCLKTAAGRFDLIFVDPPYAAEYREEALRLIAERELLRENGLVVYESEERNAPCPNGFTLCDERNYGRTVVSFYGRERE
ncbi:MAG: 16S rRNA (guanine(966)-N(2))-methyltransferase RsmD [Candidatus Gallimonas sp.]